MMHAGPWPIRIGLAFVLGLALAGCASVGPAPASAPTIKLVFEKEHLAKASSGRFFIRLSADGDPSIRGAQGQFEYLQFIRSDPYARSDVMLWVGPLGQTLGRIDRQTGSAGMAYIAYDGSQKELNRSELATLLGRFIGEPIGQDVLEQLLSHLFAVLTTETKAPNQHLLTEFRSGSSRMEIRVVPDP